MNFEISHEQRLLVDTVRDFIPPNLRLWKTRSSSTGALPDETRRKVDLREIQRPWPLRHEHPRRIMAAAGLTCLDQMMCEEQFGHTTDILIRRAFGNVYEVLLSCAGRRSTAG